LGAQECYFPTSAFSVDSARPADHRSPSILTCTRSRVYNFIHTGCMDDEKQIRWVGSAYHDLLAFPKDARKNAGFQLGKVQVGLEPADWSPFDDVGAGTREIRIREASGIYRVMFVAKFEEAIYVLHCFQKKTQVTSKQDKAVAVARYRAVVNARKEKR